MTSIKSNSSAVFLLGVAAAGFTAVPTAALAQSESDKNLSLEPRATMIDRANHTFGPAGMLEQDDGENWEWPAVIDTHVNEHAQLWIYRAWAEWMEAESWAALERSHSRAPTEAL